MTFMTDPVVASINVTKSAGSATGSVSSKVLNDSLILETIDVASSRPDMSIVLDAEGLAAAPEVILYNTEAPWTSWSREVKGISWAD